MSEEGVITLEEIQWEVKCAVAQYKDKYDEARLQWITDEMSKHIAAVGISSKMSVKVYVEKLLCLYEIKSHFL
ncbi:MAG: hypothetical protein K2Q45_09060 [Nitrosomonas sp.]|nr:hypothetical protein [Nitrosomonas sp.]